MYADERKFGEPQGRPGRGTNSGLMGIVLTLIALAIFAATIFIVPVQF